MSALGALGLSLAKDVASPAVSQLTSEIRYQLGWSDLARDRNFFYLQQFRSANPNQDLSSSNFAPWRFNTAQVIQHYNQQPWARADDNVQMQSAFAQSLQIGMQENGVNLRSTDVNGTDDEQRAKRWANENALKWRRLIDMSSTPAPMSEVIRAYYRSLPLAEERKAVDETELRFNLQRAQLRRPVDRELLLKPFVPWDAKEVMRLGAAGLIDAATKDAMLSAAGVVRTEDRDILAATQSLPDITVVIALYRRGLIDEAEARKFMALGGVLDPARQDWIFRLSLPLPPPEMLSQWANVALWNEDFARRYELDDGFDDSPIAKFFAAAQGVGQGPPTPGQPAGETDWFKLMYRSKNEMPSFAECLHMQRRLRADPDRPGRAIVGNVPPWTLQNTLDVMKMKGMTPFFTRAMEAALVYEPLNLRFINHLLHPFLEHDDFRARWQPVIGPPEQWVKAAMLDHGYRPEICESAAAGLIQQGIDAAMAEKKNNEVRLRTESRNNALKDYRVGIITQAVAIAQVQDKYTTAEMAETEVRAIDREVTRGIIERKVKTIKEEYFGGKLDIGTVNNELVAVGISDERRAQYREEWQWERTEKTRTLATNEIMAAMKAGLMAPQIAQSRMQNLGWSAPDAVVKIAQVAHDLQVAQARTAQSVATHQAALAAKVHAEQIKEAKAAAKIVDDERKRRIHVEKQLDNAAHEKLLATSEYYAKVHASNAAYAAADAKGDEEKKAAQLQRQIADYQKYLLDQLHLIQQGPEVANVIKPIDTRVAPGPVESEGGGEPADAATGAGGEPGSPAQ